VAQAETIKKAEIGAAIQLFANPTTLNPKNALANYGSGKRIFYFLLKTCRGKTDT
jgi:hypothetical protein